MADASRRRFLKVLGSAGVASLATAPVLRALADAPAGAMPAHEYFVCLMANGGWDVMLWSDPRASNGGIIEPPSTANQSGTSGVRHWQTDSSTRLADGGNPFVPVSAPNWRGSGPAPKLGPAMGNLLDHFDRLCIVNGVAMNTVDHADGQYFSSTGRHLSGGSAIEPSVDTVLASRLGASQLFPVISMAFPSAYVGQGLDARAVPLRVGSPAVIQAVLTRNDGALNARDRSLISRTLSAEADELTARAYYPTAERGIGLQYTALQQMLDANLINAFNPSALARQYPGFAALPNATPAAFTVEAIKRDAVRCVSFGFPGFDTHYNTNYAGHAALLQDMFDTIAQMLVELDVPHPALPGERLIDHTHFLVLSDFCRTPQIANTGGRDHYPNNSVLVISSRFKGGTVFGGTDEGELLPVNQMLPDGSTRPVTPADVLATFISAFGVNPPQDFFRDGAVLSNLLV